MSGEGVSCWGIIVTKNPNLIFCCFCRGGGEGSVRTWTNVSNGTSTLQRK